MYGATSRSRSSCNNQRMVCSSASSIWSSDFANANDLSTKPSASLRTNSAASSCDRLFCRKSCCNVLHSGGVRSPSAQAANTMSNHFRAASIKTPRPDRLQRSGGTPCCAASWSCSLSRVAIGHSTVSSSYSSIQLLAATVLFNIVHYRLH